MVISAGEKFSVLDTGKAFLVIFLKEWLVFTLTSIHFIIATVYFINNSNVPVNETFCEGYGFLMITKIFYIIGVLYVYLYSPVLSKSANKIIWTPLGKLFKLIFKKRFTIWAVYLILFAAIMTFLVYDTWGDWSRLVPAAGLAIFYLFGYACSKHRSKINWHIIIRGFFLQFTFGLATLRWQTGRSVFDCAGNKVTTFLGYARNGSAFVYGNALAIDNGGVFAFGAISTIYFLAFWINILYHVGVMQKVVVNLGKFLQGIMGTSICESVNSAANIFLGQTEAPLLLKPYLANMTDSELHSVMTAGFASVSGTVLAAYIDMGADPAHLITASVMAAPAGLVYSKLMFPETEQTNATEESIKLTKSEYSSVLDAASQGASQATKIVLGIIANLIAFIATVYFFNGFLGWMGELVGSDDPRWSVDLFVGYVFTPVSYVMGVKWDECRLVGELIGIKTMVNEFAAFDKYSQIKDSLSDRSKIIATFAICGFANPGSMGVMISGLGSLVPHKADRVTAHVFRAFVSGTAVCFTTACIAGMLAVS